jgi:hypothetical protein
MCAHQLEAREEDSNAMAAGWPLSIDLNRESILTDTNDVTLTLKTIRIEFFPIYISFVFEFSNKALFLFYLFSSFFLCHSLL